MTVMITATYGEASPALPPLLVTLTLDPVSQHRFDELRRAHFPPERNHLAAHVTLFHHLPGVSEEAVDAALARASRRAPFELHVTGVAALGRGVAYTLASPEVMALHSQLTAAWAPLLTRQDRRPLWPHITVQNKVSPERAAASLAELRGDFTPQTVTAEGLQLWHYLGGPWEPVRRFPFH